MASLDGFSVDGVKWGAIMPARLGLLPSKATKLRHWPGFPEMHLSPATRNDKKTVKVEIKSTRYLMLRYRWIEAF